MSPSYEDLLHCLGESLVHGEALARPVRRSAHAPQLAGDGAARFRLPFPHLGGECLASEVVAGLVLREQAALDHHLRGNASMIRARLPQGPVAAHAVIADQGIHEGVLEGVTHVQRTGDVGRRDHDAVGGVPVAGREIAVALPVLVPALFQAVRIVALIHLFPNVLVRAG